MDSLSQCSLFNGNGFLHYVILIMKRLQDDKFRTLGFSIVALNLFQGPCHKYNAL